MAFRSIWYLRINTTVYDEYCLFKVTIWIHRLIMLLWENDTNLFRSNIALDFFLCFFLLAWHGSKERFAVGRAKMSISSVLSFPSSESSNF